MTGSAGGPLAAISPRRSFAARLSLAFLATVGFLLLVTLLAVRAETGEQVELVSERAVESAERAFQQLERLRSEQLARVVAPLTDGIRAFALLEGLIETGDRQVFLQEFQYQLALNQIEPSDVFLVFVDLEGRSRLTYVGGEVLEGDDPAGVASMVAQLAEGESAERAYRVVGGRLYNVQGRLLELAGPPIGAVALGFPIGDEEVAGIGEVAGVEVCFVVDGSCVAATPFARERLATALASLAGGNEPRMAEGAGRRWEVTTSLLSRERPQDGRRVVAVPLDAVLSPFERITRTLVLSGVAALLLAVLLSSTLARSLTRPVRALVAAAGRVARGDLGTEVEVRSRDELGTLAAAFNEMTEGLRLKERYRGVLDKVVSKEIAEELVKGEIVLGGENRRATVLFADVRGFTALTEGMEPQQVIGLINECMEMLSAAVDAEGGVVDKYVGDELMAVFGAPIGRPDDALRAVRAALLMQRGMAGLNARRLDRGEAPLGVGVGINTGTVVAGNMGSKDRLNYTVLGDAVNLGARLCSGAERGEVLITGETLRAAEAAGGDLEVRPLGGRSFKGFSSDVEVLRVEGVRVPASGTSLASSPERRAHEGGSPRISLALLLLTALGASASAPATLAAQAGPDEDGWPTLRGLGLSWISSSGSLQLDLRGRLEVEAFGPDESPAWLVPETDPFVAPRLRLFADVFAGDRLYGLVEVRADRGEAPSDGDPEVRIEQLFVRAGPGPGGVLLQLGRFVSPFGGYPMRHHTAADPFIRPPLPYDFRTVIGPDHVPADVAGFLRWRDQPESFRAIGSPAVWGAPYPWGALLSVARGRVDLRAAVLNSAPSSEPEAWGIGESGLGHPTLTAGGGVQLAPELRLDLSWSRAPYLRSTLLEASAPLPAHASHDAFVQELWSLEAAWARGPAVVRGEVIEDRWEVPNVGDDPVDLSWYLEAQADLFAGAYGAMRVGRMDFMTVEDGSARGEWDYDLTRIQVGAGYRLARNAGLRAEWMTNRSRGPLDPEDDLWSVQLWWEF